MSYLHTHALTTTAILSLLAMGVVACNKEKGTSEEAAAKSSPSAARGTGPSAAPKIGDSCKGISAVDGQLGCDGSKVIFCSSFSNYEWKMQRECASGQTCTLSPDGKSASCK